MKFHKQAAMPLINKKRIVNSIGLSFPRPMAIHQEGTSNMQTLLKAMSLLLGLLTFCSTTEAADLIPLRAGPVTMVFDADNVFLRYIRVGSHEILRGINAPIRNQNWATISPQVSHLNVENHGDSFAVTFDATCQQADIDFRWQGTITGSKEGVVEFTFAGEAFSTFKRNRIGFCVLHGPSAAGQPWQLELVDGQKVGGQFPDFISAHQPAKNLRAITHQVAPFLQARVDFEGETFEMEDQRNWTDASFKTYCTPLALPYPVEIPKGTKIFQKIRISLAGKALQNPQEPSSQTLLTLEKSKSPIPRLGLQISNEFKSLTDKQLEQLKALNLDHLRVDLHLSDKAFVDQLQRANAQSKALGVSLQVSLGLGKSPNFKKLLKEIKKLQPNVSFWLVRGGDPADFERAKKELTSVLGTAKLGVTRATNFVDLNRARPEGDSIQAVGFAITPQIHAFDHASMVETLPIQADAVRSAREFSADRPLVIGPITLTPQLLDGIDQPGGPPQGGPLPTYIDKRQVEPFTAVWTLGSVKHLADASTHSATFFETIGWNGIMDADDVSARPQAFPSRPGKRFPVYQLLREIGEFQGGSVQKINSSNDLSAVGLALRKPGHMRVLVGNLTGESQTITLRGISGKAVTVQLLNGQEIQATPELAISLPPYGIARINRVVD